MSKLLRGLKRLGKVALAGGISYAVTFVGQNTGLISQEIGPVATMVLTAILTGIEKAAQREAQ